MLEQPRWVRSPAAGCCHTLIAYASVEVLKLASRAWICCSTVLGDRAAEHDRTRLHSRIHAERDRTGDPCPSGRTGPHANGRTRGQAMDPSVHDFGPDRSIDETGDKTSFRHRRRRQVVKLDSVLLIIRTRRLRCTQENILPSAVNRRKGRRLTVLPTTASTRRPRSEVNTPGAGSRTPDVR